MPDHTFGPLGPNARCPAFNSKTIPRATSQKRPCPTRAHEFMADRAQAFLSRMAYCINLLDD